MHGMISSTRHELQIQTPLNREGWGNVFQISFVFSFMMVGEGLDPLTRSTVLDYIAFL